MGAEKVNYNYFYTVELENGKLLENVPGQMWVVTDPETKKKTHYFDENPEVNCRPDWLHRYKKMFPGCPFETIKELKDSMTKEDFVAFKWSYVKQYLPKVKSHNRRTEEVQAVRAKFTKFQD